MATAGIYLVGFQDCLTTGTLAVCFVAFMCAYIFVNQRNRNLPPGPLKLPLIGNVLTVIISNVYREHPHDLMTRLAKKYGIVFCLGFGSGIRCVVLNNFASIAEAFKNPNVQDRAYNELSNKSIGAHGILNASGELWKHQRRFSLSVFRSFGVGKSSFEERIMTEADFLSKEFNALSGKPFDPKHHLMNATSNIICAIIFGKRYNYGDEEFKRILIILDNRIQLIGAGGFHIFVPLLRFVFPQIERKTIGMMRESVKYLKPIIAEHRSRVNTCDDVNDFIDLYLKEIEKSQQDDEQSSPEYLDETHLLAVIDSLFVAGTETSSNTLGWSLLYMAAYPDVQQRLQNEIKSVCGERLPSYGDQQNMPYTQAVILELQRLHTVVPLGIPHCAGRDTTIQGYSIPKGTIIISNLWRVLHDPDVWHDPDTFKPERFLNEEGEIHIPKEWIPFSTGRRICLGERLAKMEIFIFLTHLLRRFSFKKPDSHFVPCFEGRSGVTFSPLPYKIVAVTRYDKD